MRLGLATVGRAKFYFIAHCSKLNLVLYCGIPECVAPHTGLLQQYNACPGGEELKPLDFRSNQFLTQHKTDWTHEHMKQFFINKTMLGFCLYLLLLKLKADRKFIECICTSNCLHLIAI